MQSIYCLEHRKVVYCHIIQICSMVFWEVIIVGTGNILISGGETEKRLPNLTRFNSLSIFFSICLSFSKVSFSRCTHHFPDGHKHTCVLMCVARYMSCHENMSHAGITVSVRNYFIYQLGG